jgi:two-component sensor histidine kinase
MIRKFRYQLLLFFLLLIGAVILQSINASRYDSEIQKQEKELTKMHEESLLNIQARIDVYSMVVSSIRSFTKNAVEFPTEQQLQDYVSDLIRDTNFKDSIVVSWVDTNQVFRYVVTPYEIDPHDLKGTLIRDLRTDFEVERLNKLMLEDDITLFKPINLVEGWAAFPFNFSARNSQGEILGYIAPVLNVKYLLNSSYSRLDSLFIHQFTLENSVDFTREVVYDGTTIYNKSRDPEYYRNFVDSETQFIYSTLDFYGLELKIGTAFKETPTLNYGLTAIAYLWYAILCFFSFITISQFIKNNRLNKTIKLAHGEVEDKNIQLEESLSNIQILIKEIHHRVKNNMQIITSLMNLQSSQLKNEESKSALEESKARIQSMALVHEKLYGNDNMTNVNAEEYIAQLISYVENTFEADFDIPEKKIAVASDILFDMDTMVPLGLIINELVTNSYKYAFKHAGEKWVRISIVRESEGFQLNYSDSGPGIPENITPSESGTLGLELIYILAEQLQGGVNYKSEDENMFIIRFKKALKK